MCCQNLALEHKQGCAGSHWDSKHSVFLNCNIAVTYIFIFVAVFNLSSEMQMGKSLEMK
jgi:hypothetical protein